MASRTVTRWPRSPSQPFSRVACFFVQTLSGDPSGVQMLAYLAADFAGRVRRMMPCRISAQTARGIATTRGTEDREPARHAGRLAPTARGYGEGTFRSRTRPERHAPRVDSHRIAPRGRRPGARRARLRSLLCRAATRAAL